MATQQITPLEATSSETTLTAKAAEPVPRAMSFKQRTTQHDLCHDTLKALTDEEEMLAYLGTMEPLSDAALHRLALIEAELDRRWTLFG